MGGIPLAPLAPYPISNFVKVHLRGNPPVSLVPPVSLLVGFPKGTSPFAQFPKVRCEYLTATWQEHRTAPCRVLPAEACNLRRLKLGARGSVPRLQLGYGKPKTVCPVSNNISRHMPESQATVWISFLLSSVVYFLLSPACDR